MARARAPERAQGGLKGPGPRPLRVPRRALKRARAQALKEGPGGPLKGPGLRPLRGPGGALKRAWAQALKKAQGGL